MKRKTKAVVPLWCLGQELILAIRHAYFRGVRLEDIAHENNLQVEDVESVIDAMNL